MWKQPLSAEQALQKLKHYCAYQERCHSEVREKLFSLGVRKNERETIITTLIVENYLNEERFAIAYAGGKWRMKRWGRNRIKYALKQKGVSEYNIKKALKQIDDEEYTEVLKKELTEKYALLKKDQWLVRKKKTIDYLVGKGFEPALVNQLMNELRG
jgi:regulatory protein